MFCQNNISEKKTSHNPGAFSALRLNDGKFSANITRKPAQKRFLQNVRTGKTSFTVVEQLNGETVYWRVSFFLRKYAFVSRATIPFNASSAIRLGNAIKPLKISAIVQTAETVIYGPMNTARI